MGSCAFVRTVVSRWVNFMRGYHIPRSYCILKLCCTGVVKYSIDLKIFFPCIQVFRETQRPSYKCLHSLGPTESQGDLADFLQRRSDYTSRYRSGPEGKSCKWSTQFLLDHVADFFRDSR